jgi:aryl-alcohol dehydrogenase-like predicted oxidoreductase
VRYRPLGNTGLQVSEISLGTAEIGLDYGFKGNPNYPKPDLLDSVRLIHAALDHGINLLDTAPVYGHSEEIIGRALRGVNSPPYITSKVMLCKDAPDKELPALRQEIFASIERSLQTLKRDSIDVLLIHNTTLNHLRKDEIQTCLEEAQQQGKILFFGASCYGEEVPLAALQRAPFRALQVPFNLLDQKMNERVFSAAVVEGVGGFVRSAFLRGVLTDHANLIPQRLAPLRAKALQALALLRGEVDNLAEAALRFCLSFNSISSVVIGVKTVSELESNLADASKGALPLRVMPRLQELSFDNDPLVDTRNWRDLT